jgi:hypothetical protein
MDDSYISHGKGGTMFVGTDAISLYRASMVCAGLGLFKSGIRPSRGWTLTKALRIATEYTGKPYKRTEVDRARADLKIWIDTMKCAMPVERDE